MIGPTKIKKEGAVKHLSGKIEGFITTLHSPQVIYRKATGTISGSLNDPTLYLKLNIGGVPYTLQKKTILRRPWYTLLHRFVAMDHETKLTIADDYDEVNKEYFFERSWQLFDPVYRYFTSSSGICHRPYGVCWTEFLLELEFWGLNKSDECYASCCWPEHEKVKTEEAPKLLEQCFDNVCCPTLRYTVWNFLEEPQSSIGARIASILSVCAVLVSNAGLVLGSMQAFQVPIKGFQQPQPHPTFEQIEYCCIGWFTLEYGLKLAVASNRKPVFLKPMNLVDLFAILPFYIELVFTLAGFGAKQLGDFKSALLALRILRALRIMRIFKLGRYSKGVQVFAETLRMSAKHLMMLSMIVMVGMMFFSTLIYFAEKENPESQFYSIVSGFWWCGQTMTSAGYGDVIPCTMFGKVIASGAVLSGILVLVLPISIVADNYMQIMADEDEKESDKPKSQPPSTNSTPPPSPHGFHRRQKKLSKANGLEEMMHIHSFISNFQTDRK